MFISIDGVEGCGKSTQVERLCAHLQREHIDTAACRDPGGTRLSEEVRKLLLGCHDWKISNCSELFLFLSARAQLVAEIVAPSLRSGKTVVSDRYALSTVAYQGYGRGLDIAMIRMANFLAVSSVMPDLTIVLDIPPDVMEARLNRKLDRIESLGAEFHERVRQGFLKEAERSTHAISLIDGTGTVDEVEERIWDLIWPRFSCRHGS